MQPTHVMGLVAIESRGLIAYLIYRSLVYYNTLILYCTMFFYLSDQVPLVSLFDQVG